jgi:radical SAM superfamily enzyme YgiQ (UPF0313 family)
MIGFPGETWETIKATSAEAIRLNPDIAVFPVLTPMPFTPLWGEMHERIRVFDYSQYNLVTPIIEPHAMSMQDITIAMGRCYMTSYANKMTEILALPRRLQAPLHAERDETDDAGLRRALRLSWHRDGQDVRGDRARQDARDAEDAPDAAHAGDTGAAEEGLVVVPT